MRPPEAFSTSFLVEFDELMLGLVDGRGADFHDEVGRRRGREAGKNNGGGEDEVSDGARAQSA